MQNEENNQQIDSQTEFAMNFLTHILDMMKHVVSDAGGIVPEEMRGAFEKILEDTEGNPYVQTVAGAVMTTKEGLAAKQIFYSPNLAVDGESVCIELANIMKYTLKTGYDLVVCTGHYVDPEGVVSYGAEARKIKRFVEQTALLNNIKQMQEEMKNQPRLVLPDSKIITR
ncbi:hypothetical protein DEEACLCL_00142 [Salmonella phage CRW-SP2]|nr:hypothetical protein DEEACLCL_00142 [Salmonella phage CRW-SP2]